MLFSSGLIKKLSQLAAKP